jgi:hypothetical protein
MTVGKEMATGHWEPRRSQFVFRGVLAGNNENLRWSLRRRKTFIGPFLEVQLRIFFASR